MVSSPSSSTWSAPGPLTHEPRDVAAKQIRRDSIHLGIRLTADIVAGERDVILVNIARGGSRAILDREGGIHVDRGGGQRVVEKRNVVAARVDRTE